MATSCFRTSDVRNRVAVLNDRNALLFVPRHRCSDGKGQQKPGRAMLVLSNYGVDANHPKTAF
jgi:hypothetical protein